MGFNSGFKGLIKLEFFSKDFCKKTQISNFMKIRSVEVESYHWDRQTDMTNLMSRFANSANASQNRSHTGKGK